VTTRAVNLRRDEFDIYVGRKGHGYLGYYGNPFVRGNAGRGEALKLFVPWFARRVLEDREFLVSVLELRDLRLACFCVPAPCHAQVYVDFIENFPKDWADALIAEWRRDHPKPQERLSDLSRRIRA
jgi:hypothetical protein